MAAPTPATRPQGITILAILAAISGVFGLLGGIAVVGFGVLAIAVGSLAFAYGAWTLKPWAWTLGVAVEILGILLNILWITQGASISSVAISIIIALAILYYLDTPAVRAAFGKPTKSIFGGMTKR
jgi:hypothetical protein